MAKSTKLKSKAKKAVSVKAKPLAKMANKKVKVVAKKAKAPVKLVKKATVVKAKGKSPKLSLAQAKVKRLTKERSNAVGMSLKNISSSNRDYPFSGKFTVRLPKSLHQALVERSKKEGVSLNLFVTNALSRTVASAGSVKKK